MRSVEMAGTDDDRSHESLNQSPDPMDLGHPMSSPLGSSSNHDFHSFGVPDNQCLPVEESVFGEDSRPDSSVISPRQIDLTGAGESHIVEMPPDPNGTDVSQRGRISIATDQGINHSRQNLTFLMIPVQVSAILLTSASSTASCLQFPNCKLLFQYAVCCNFIGFLFLLYVLLVGDRLSGSVSRIMQGIGYTATSYGFLAAMGMMLQDSVMLWVTFAACIICIPALLSTFLKERQERSVS